MCLLRMNPNSKVLVSLNPTKIRYTISGLRFYGKEFVLLQDNNLKHASHLCKNYLKRKKEKGDLNPIQVIRRYYYKLYYCQKR